MNDKYKKRISTIALIPIFGLFVSTAIQVGFAVNLNVPTVPLDITMKTEEAVALPGLAARDWAAGTCLMFAVMILLSFLGRYDRRGLHTLICIILFVTLLPILQVAITSSLPPGADWIVMHHLFAGVLIFVTRPSRELSKRWRTSKT